MVLDPTRIDSFEAPYDLVKSMRASILVLGPLLAKYGRAKVSLPGGCAIGVRPIDMHLKAFTKMGAQIELSHGYVMATAEILMGTRFVFDNTPWRYGKRHDGGMPGEALPIVGAAREPGTWTCEGAQCNGAASKAWRKP